MLGVHLDADVPDSILYALLGVLLYTTFVQVPMAHLPAALKDRRYLSARPPERAVTIAADTQACLVCLNGAPKVAIISGLIGFAWKQDDWIFGASRHTERFLFLWAGFALGKGDDAPFRFCYGRICVGRVGG